MTKNNSLLAMICKISAVVIFIIYFLIGIISGSESYGFNFLGALLIWISGFTTGIILFALGEIVDNTSYLVDNKDNKYYFSKLEKQNNLIINKLNNIHNNLNDKHDNN